jgi:hypothetical protein
MPIRKNVVYLHDQSERSDSHQPPRPHAAGAPLSARQLAGMEGMAGELTGAGWFLVPSAHRKYGSFEKTDKPRKPTAVWYRDAALIRR